MGFFKPLNLIKKTLMNLFKLLFVLLFSTSIIAQTSLSKKNLDSLPNTISNQFSTIFQKGNSWHEYKMIKKTEFVSFRKNVLDSISIIKNDIVVKQKLIKKQENTITSLKDTISLINKDLNIALGKENNISLLGAQVKKTLYNTILFSIIIALLIALLFFIFKFKNSSTITSEARKNLIDTEKELEDYRKKAIEKEQKLRRQLQDEINKQRGV